MNHAPPSGHSPHTDAAAPSDQCVVSSCVRVDSAEESGPPLPSSPQLSESPVSTEGICAQAIARVPPTRPAAPKPSWASPAIGGRSILGRIAPKEVDMSPCIVRNLPPLPHKGGDGVEGPPSFLICPKLPSGAKMKLPANEILQLNEGPGAHRHGRNVRSNIAKRESQSHRRTARHAAVPNYNVVTNDRANGGSSLKYTTPGFTLDTYPCTKPRENLKTTNCYPGQSPRMQPGAGPRRKSRSAREIVGDSGPSGRELLDDATSLVCEHHISGPTEKVAVNGLVSILKPSMRYINKSFSKCSSPSSNRSDSSDIYCNNGGFGTANYHPRDEEDFCLTSGGDVDKGCGPYSSATATNNITETLGNCSKIEEISLRVAYNNFFNDDDIPVVSTRSFTRRANAVETKLTVQKSDSSESREGRGAET
uniref:Uncharacterized protein n=1 Tax=Trypanosoma congolense (strain IL3000) TaxID=1068625 RepID=G0UVS0_TRYCI|nr:conserved hypothetical protein [Trypanosoma congolense IL3000]